MAKKSLLSSSQLKQIESAIKSVTDTFMRYPIKYIKRSTSLDRFQENRQERKTQEYNLEALVVFNPGPGGLGKDNQNSDGAGSFDDSDGYILFHIDDLKDVGLVDVKGNFIGESNSDWVIYQEQKLLIMGNTIGAPLIDKNLLVRFTFKIDILNG